MHSRVRERGATLLDAVVGTALMLIVFVGIVGAFQLTVQAVGNNKSRAGAIALANERSEYIRSLAYSAIGTVGGIPAGALAQTETVVLNDTNYTRRTFVSYEDDPQDGTGGADQNGIVTDYKAVKTSVAWESRQGTRTITMVTRVSPPGVESMIPGGTLAIQVTNDTDAPVSNAQVRIVNSTVNPAIDMTTYTDEDGMATVLGAPAGADYEIAVTKASYSSSQTYSADVVNTNPIPAHLGVALNQTTAANFEIDLLSTLSVQTFSPVEEEMWDDSFNDSSKVGFQDGVEVAGGSLVLASGEEGYGSLGTAISSAIAPQYLFVWKEFSWDGMAPDGTDVRYHVHTDSGALIPDVDLAGNGAGFSSPPISLTGLSTTSYPALKVGAALSSSDPNETPTVGSWQVTYDTGPTPLPDIPFSMQGVKTIGSGPGGPVYKYSASHTTDSAGSVSILNVEYDTYALSAPSSSGYDVSSSCPVPQPIVIAPGSSASVQLHLVPHTANSLLVDVRAAGGAYVSNASVQLTRAAYDATVVTDACGQAFFSGITASDGTPYSISVSAAGYQLYQSSDVEVTGTTRLSIILNN